MLNQMPDLTIETSMLDGAEAHRPLLTGADHAVDELVAVEALSAAVLLDDHDGQALHRFIGGEALLA